MNLNLPYIKKDLTESYNRIQPHIHKTPVLSSKLINEMAGCELYFKCENFQKAGSFKIRGATNAILQLTEDEQQKGVVTHSSGNFAQALALAARNLNIPAYIVMPENAPKVKVEAVRGYGAEIRFCINKQEERERTMREWQEETGAAFLHPYDNRNVILGQSTCGYELIEEVPGLDNIISPVGGGGLISGIALSTKFFSPKTKVFAAEPAGADDAQRSFRNGKIYPSVNPNTIADGLLTSLGEHTFPVIRSLVTDIYTVTDEEIIKAMKLVWTRMKTIIEPSSATTLAVILKNKTIFANQKNALIVSGGNVDLNKLPF
jgi:threonine dehydratase